MRLLHVHRNDELRFVKWPYHVYVLFSEELDVYYIEFNTHDAGVQSLTEHNLVRGDFWTHAFDRFNSL